MNLKLIFGISVVVIILAGSTLGYFLGRKNSSMSDGSEAIQGAVKTETEAGIKDTKNYPDSAQGVLQDGGINGEGTHNLVRDGGPSQTVYLISSVVDLSDFVGKKVEIWGQTLDAQRAGWLMDVGLVKVLE